MMKILCESFANGSIRGEFDALYKSLRVFYFFTAVPVIFRMLNLYLSKILAKIIPS